MTSTPAEMLRYLQDFLAGIKRELAALKKAKTTEQNGEP